MFLRSFDPYFLCIPKNCLIKLPKRLASVVLLQQLHRGVQMGEIFHGRKLDKSFKLQAISLNTAEAARRKLKAEGSTGKQKAESVYFKFGLSLYLHLRAACGL